MEIELSVNGETKKCSAEPGEYLAQVLRETLGMTGTKRGCDTGGCGMCTVLLDGKPIYSCMMPAWKAEGREITTIESMATDEAHLNDLQKAMVTNFAFQCGYCTGAMLLVGKSIIDSNETVTEENVRSALCGVLCRCTNYEGYINSIISASQSRRR